MSGPAASLTWVVGEGGLLGSALVESVARTSPLWSAGRLDWGTDRADEQLRSAAQGFLKAAGDQPWRVAWCAGAAVTGADQMSLRAEARAFDALLAGLAETRQPRHGSVFVASSAGGVYAGSAGQPFDEDTVPVPLAPYGHAKLAIEGAARRFHDATGCSVLVGRLSNLYGPRQNLAKAQGLISQIARSVLLAQPISIYVSLDTLRDYLFAADAAGLVEAGLDRLAHEVGAANEPVWQTKILASQLAVTIGFLVSEISRISKRRPVVVYGSSATSKFQARDLRLRSEVWTELDRRTLTPYPVGIRQTLDGIAASMRSGSLS